MVIAEFGVGCHNAQAIITGASRGIGRAIALVFSEAGAKVVLTSRKIERVEEVARKIMDQRGEAIAFKAHMGDPDQVASLVKQSHSSRDRIGIAVNNAATNPHYGPLLTAEENKIREDPGYQP